jgi:hypothetical protein
MSRGRIKPGSGPSLVGMIVGVLFVILGLTVFIPLTNAAGFPASIFAIIWTVIAATITLYYGMNLFRRGGAPIYDIDIETKPAGATSEADFDQKLRKLTRLKEDGLISTEEYLTKRAELMHQRW